MNFFLKTGIGWGIKQFAPTISRKIGKFFENYIRPFGVKLGLLDDYIEEKLGDILPDNLQEAYSDLISYAVEFTEASMTDPAKIRFILNAILRGDTNFSKDDLKLWAGKNYKDFLLGLPKELKDLISAHKLEIGVSLFESLWERLYGAKPDKSHVVGAITASVKEKNEEQSNLEPEPSLTELWEKLTEESKERQGK